MTKEKIDHKKLILETAEELLKQLQVEAKVSVEEKDEAFNVQIETEDTGILIGYHGETLSSFQLILALMIYKKIGQWTKIIVNVGDWRQRREEALQQMALSSAEKVVTTGEAVVLPDLSSFERRAIHMALADHPKVTTVSEGEGNERKLIIKPK